MSYLVQWRTKSQQDLINKINSNLDSIKMNFFEIAAYLYEAQQRLFYHGYNNITDFAKDNFGFEKTLTYDLIKIFRMFGDKNSYLPDNSITHLNQTQLVALCNCQSGRNQLAAIISPKDNVKDVKRAVKLFNAASIKKRSTYKAKNLVEFFEEFKHESKIVEGKYQLNKKENKVVFSAQTENKKSKWKPVPIRDYVIDLMGEENTNKFAKKLSEAIFNLKDCLELFTVGSEYRNKLIEEKEKMSELFNIFYYGTKEQNL